MPSSISCSRRMRVAAQHVVAGHELARDAEAALHRAVLEERRLERRHLAAASCSGQPFDGHDRAAVRLDRENQARVDDALVEPHRARAALADGAALLGARQSEVVAQRLEQRVVLAPRWTSAAGR